MEAAAAAQLILLALRAGSLALEQVKLMDLDTLPPELRLALIEERDGLNASLARLDSLGR